MKNLNAPNNYSTSRNFRENEKRKKVKQFAMLYFVLFVMISFTVILFFLVQNSKKTPNTGHNVAGTQNDGKPSETNAPTGHLSDTNLRASLIKQADQLSVGYDYDKAIALLKKGDGYEQYKDITDKINQLETIKSSLVEIDTTDIPHFFTHPLIYDPKIGFASDMKLGYQQESITVDEFNNFLTQMYRNDYVLINVHDLATQYVDKKKRIRLRKNTILLPKGKKAFIFSEDDTNYYQRWQQKGVGSRMVVGADGKPTCEVDLSDGTKIRGNYDVIPCLEAFIEKHPDFSYQGARASIGVTGIEGVLGYRTSLYKLGEWDDSSVNSEDKFNINSPDAQAAIQVSAAIRKAGYSLVSHSFVHGAYYGANGYCSNPFLKYDIKRFETEIEPLIGKTDVILYPNGADIEHGEDQWKYKLTNYRFNKLFHSGLRYFFNVDTNVSTPWESYGSNYVRGRRVGLIGYTILCKKDYMKENFGLNTRKLVDKNRPIPKYLDYYGTHVDVDAR